MASEGISGKVALRLFFLLVGVLFIWNSIPSHRWTKNVASDIQTGLWTTCSCTDNGFKDCNRAFTELEKAQFRIEYADEKNLEVDKVKNKDTKDLRNKHEQYLFHSKDGNKDSQSCDQYNGSGAIALISYIFAFLAVLVVIKNIAGNVLPVLNGAVFGLIILSGIFGLIATCMFGDLYGHQNYPFGYHFGLFTTAWVLFLFVGLTGMSDLNKGAKASETTSAVRAALLVLALTAFAFSMGNNWYVHDQQSMIVPSGDRDWTIKDGTFFIEQDNELGWASVQKDVIAEANKGIKYCNPIPPPASESESPSPIPSESQSSSESSGNSRRNGDRETAEDQESRKNHNGNGGKTHRKDECVSDPNPHLVQGTYEIGLWENCLCKNTLSTQCSLFGSYDIMFNNKQKKCDTFNVSRAMILMVGILSLMALVLSSALLGGLRKVELHTLSNTLCALASVLGLISTILFGVLYSVNDLGRDFAIYLAGWWLVFFAAVLGGPVTGYYREVQNAGQVAPIPLQ